MMTGRVNNNTLWALVILSIRMLFILLLLVLLQACHATPWRIDILIVLSLISSSVTTLEAHENYYDD